jgi:hypothetical protein
MAAFSGGSVWSAVRLATKAHDGLSRGDFVAGHVGASVAQGAGQVSGGVVQRDQNAAAVVGAGVLDMVAVVVESLERLHGASA